MTAPSKALTTAVADGLPAERADTAGAQTLRRGLAVLRLLTRVGPGGLRMNEIGRRLGLNKSTAIRLTRTLVDEGFVLHDPHSGAYRLGPEAFAVGLAAEPSYALQRLAAPLMRALALESGDTVFFTVLHGTESICLSRTEGDFPIRNQLVKAGDRWPLGVGAGSCAMLAALSDAAIADILGRNAAERLARYPDCTDAAIRELVAQTRAQGYCVNPGLVLASSWAIGVPVYDRDGRPVASISLAAIESRLGPARRAALGNRLRVASQELQALQRGEHEPGEDAPAAV
ncbi:IclR family transcriptional regulator [Leptothrix discophora]|uniref:IclR family transcriptional regulator n=1 Tax=Leptothrix discophora TaxID=89 RepID=A0ABT9G9N7_LEPDI|nr:IclR family transcriptional regulator [Leptothrix discophora]MDP4302973.1 IclR family transcriptional regulator [Leptothrix discophora]